jgi:excinuclease UvrABC nuclease subunit
VRDIADIEWIVVGSELEALILEMNLIKKHRPKYNIRLKDDKRYPYIKIHWNEPFPKVTVTRQMVDDGARYFGPYTSAWAVYQTLEVLRKIFPYLTCDREITGNDPRACLYYDIKLCTAPCIGAINQQGYRQMISDLMEFLSGHSEGIIERLKLRCKKPRMRCASRKPPHCATNSKPCNPSSSGRRSSSARIMKTRMSSPWRAKTAKPACRSSSSAAAS